MQPQRHQSFTAFYPFYLSEHSNRISRGLHVIGTGFSLLLIIGALASRHWPLLLAALVCGYAFAWVGHVAFEKNRPATFTYPLWSLMGDFRLFFETLTGRRAF